MPSGISCAVKRRRLSFERRGKGRLAPLDGGVHHRDERRPIDLGAAPQLERPGVVQARRVVALMSA